MTDKRHSMYQHLIRNDIIPNRTAIRFLGKSISYKKVLNEIDILSSALLSLKLNQGDIITIALPNIPSAVTLVYAANKIGIKVNLIHPLSPVKHIIQYMRKCSSVVLFGFDKIINNYINILNKENIIVIACQVQDYLSGFENVFYNAFTTKDRSSLKGHVTYLKYLLKTSPLNLKAVDSQDFAVIMHSGGTTEAPKSIMLTDYNFNCIADNTIDVLPLDKKNIATNIGMLAVLPLFHAFGLGVCIHTALCYKIKTILVPKYSPKLISQLCRTEDIRLLAGVPTMYKGVISQKGFKTKHLSKLLFAFCGGDKLNASLKQEFDETMAKFNSPCKLDEGYGLTEASGVFSVNTRAYTKEGSVGKPLGDYTIEAFDVENRKLLNRGEYGELCICASTVMKGYLNDQAASDLSIFKVGEKVWLRTGDLGSVDSEGYIFFKQRIKRIVKVSGVPVFPSEVEECICEIKQVKMCCVVGIPNDLKGSVLKAYVVLNEDANDDEIKKEIFNYCKANLNKWSYPREVEIRDNLPLTSLGKADYRKFEN